MEYIVTYVMSRLRIRERLEKGSDKKQIRYCLNSDGLILHMRSIQGYSGGTKVDPTLLDNVPIPYK